VQNGYSAVLSGDLLTSMLPINPAFVMYSAAPMQNQCSAISSGDILAYAEPMQQTEHPAFAIDSTSAQHDHCSTRGSEDLIMSKLPINPAFKTFSTCGDHHQIWSDMQSAVTADDTGSVKTDTEFRQDKEFMADLLTSELPINPGFRAWWLCKGSLEI